MSDFNSLHPHLSQVMLGTRKSSLNIKSDNENRGDKIVLDNLTLLKDLLEAFRLM